MGNELLQPSLAGGELAPSEYGRVDIARYQNSLALCRNWIVQPYGGLRNRPGTSYVSTVKVPSEVKIRLIPFQWSSWQTAVIELGNFYARFHSGSVLDTIMAYAWSSSTSYTYGTAVTYGGHGYICTSVSSTNKIPGVSSDWYQLVLASGNYYILEIPTPWATSALASLTYSQSNDVVTICHNLYQPQEIRRYVDGYSQTTWACVPFSNKGGPWQGVNADTSIMIYADSPINGTANSGSDVNLVASKPVFQNATVGQLIQITQDNMSCAWEVAKTVAVGDIRRSVGNFYQALTSGVTGTDRPVSVSGIWNDGTVNWQWLHAGTGYAVITGITNSTNATAHVMDRIPDGAVIPTGAAPPGGTGVFTITSGIGSPYDDVNGKYLMFSFHLSVAAPFALGQIIWLSIHYNSTYGGTGLSYAGPGIVWNGGAQDWACQLDLRDMGFDDDSWLMGFVLVSGTVAQYSGGVGTGSTSSNVGTATHLWALGAWGGTYGVTGGQGYPACCCYHQQRLVFGNSLAAPTTVWMSQTGSRQNFGTSNPIQDDDAITFTLAATQMNAIQNFLPMDALVIFTTGAEWMVVGPSNGVLTPSNLEIHMQGYRGAAPLQPVAVGNTALFIQNKGSNVRNLKYEFMSNTYAGNDVSIWANHYFEGHTILDWCYQQVPSSVAWFVRDDGVLLGLTYLPEQEVAAWHQHTTDGTFESICCVSAGNEDAIYVVVKRHVNGTDTRYIERFGSRTVTDIKQGMFLDSGNLIYSDNAKSTLTGLTWLEGKTIGILGDGYVQTPKLVTGGTVTLDTPAHWISYGLPYNSDGQLLPVNIAPNGESAMAKFKAIPVTRFLVSESQSLWAGHSLTALNRVWMSPAVTTPALAPPGIVTVRPAGRWDQLASICFRHSDPTPCTVLALIPEVTVGDN